MQQSIIKILKQAQEKVRAAKDVVTAKMEEARQAVLRAQRKVESWRAGKGDFIYEEVMISALEITLMLIRDDDDIVVITGLIIDYFLLNKVYKLKIALNF